MTPLEKKSQEMKVKYKISDAMWEDFFTDLGEVLVLLLKSSKPYLAQADSEIIKAIKDLDGMGQIQMNFNIFNGGINYGVFTYSKKVKFD